MLAFGLLHGIVFSGDIIGAYGLVAVIFAEVIVMRRAWARILAGSLLAVLSLSGLWMGGSMMGREPMALEYHGHSSLNAWYPLVSFESWIVATPATVLTAFVVPLSGRCAARRVHCVPGGKRSRK
jgi:hypothetical protein